MTSWHSLLACAQADVTIERITSLAATTGTEPLTVDFKEKASPRLAECVASMANAHGGLILVGITDTDRKIVGVKTETLHHVADQCREVKASGALSRGVWGACRQHRVPTCPVPPDANGSTRAVVVPDCPC